MKYVNGRFKLTFSNSKSHSTLLEKKGCSKVVQRNRQIISNDLGANLGKKLPTEHGACRGVSKLVQ